jgi:LCP family protein required for cell wall assembly
MSTPQRAPRSRSAFGAAFLSLLFPGLGHAYAGAPVRALGFAAVPLLLVALLLGIVIRGDRAALLGMMAAPAMLTAIFIGNIIALVYRVAAAVDAWQVARFLNAADASGGGRLGRARMPLNPISIAGLLSVILVMGIGHVAVARYDLLGMKAVNCIFTEESNPDCDQPSGTAAAPGTSAQPSDTEAPGDSGVPAEPTDAIPTPASSATGSLAPSLPPWNGKDRLNILAVGVDAREGDGSSFNTDTLIVISIDPVTNQVAMFQVPRDMVDVPVPANARALWGSTYAGKVNSWYNQNRNRTDLWPGRTATSRGFNALKALLGELYGLDIRYYVKVDFGGFRDAVNTLGGLQVNVQMPVYESEYPSGGGFLTRLYIPAGPQHMTGAEALRYARSRHRSTDFDRGRRQQRVIISLKDQMNVQAIFANLDQLLDDVGRSVKTDIPVGELPKMLSLADEVDTKNIRSYVFSPNVYATEYAASSRGYIITPNISRIRRAVREAFSVSAELLAQRDRLGEEQARVWVQDASGRSLSTGNAEWLAYNGLDASAPNRKVANQLATTEIKVYNGAETRMAETVAFLEKVYGATVVSVVDPTVTVDFIVTLGRNAPAKQVDALG